MILFLSKSSSRQALQKSLQVDTHKLSSGYCLTRSAGETDLKVLWLVQADFPRFIPLEGLLATLRLRDSSEGVGQCRTFSKDLTELEALAVVVSVSGSESELSTGSSPRGK